MKVERPSVRAGTHEVHLEGDAGAFAVELSCEQLAERLHVVRLALDAAQPARPHALRLVFTHPSVDIQARWHPAALHARNLPSDWAPGFHSELTRNAPVVCLHNLAGCNRLTLACSDVLNPIEIRAGVQEESGEVRCRVHLFGRTHPAIKHHEVQLLIDTRESPYYEALDHVQHWWRSMPGCAPRAVPQRARLPMYSTWYSFHQNVEPAAVLEQCRIARELGCEAVIVDDGWQTSDDRRGYAYSGDWEPRRIPEMRRFVDDVHDLGMQFMLWYALPFVGIHTRAYERFQGKLLTQLESLHAGVLDPRYPEVREYLVSTLERAMLDWGLDGFKIDFVDEFAMRGLHPPELKPGMDFLSVPEAAHHLLETAFDRLLAIRSDLMVEFRQEYIGPMMRRFGNMFRAGDCPNDALTNRLRTLDIRLLCGETACHSDMFMWHPGDSVESAALQVLSVLFSVPQVSVRLDRLPAAHREMLRFWLGFWRAHRDVLLDGKLEPMHPEAMYPAVTARTGHKCVVALYADMVAQPGLNVPAQLFLVNATAGSRVVLQLDESLGRRRVQAFDCQGHVVSDDERMPGPGVHLLAVPKSGLIALQAV